MLHSDLLSGRPPRDRTSALALAALGSTVPLILAILLLAALPFPALAQQGRTSVDLQVGVTAPKGDMDGVHDDYGVTVHLGAAHRVLDRVELRVEGSRERLYGAERQSYLGADVEGPDAALYHLVGNLGVELTPPENRWEVGVAAGGGMTWLDVEETEDFETIYAGDLDRAALTDTALTGNAGMWVGWQATETLLLFYRCRPTGCWETRPAGRTTWGRSSPW